MAPVAVLSVPLPLDAKLFTTHVERPPFTIGNGGPNAHPVTVQSMPSPPPGLAPSVQVSPTQPVTRNRLVAPSGIGPSGTVEPPPPRLSVPQPRLRIVTAPAACDTPHAPLPEVVVKSSTTVPGGGCVVVDVLELVDVVLVVGAPVVDVVGAPDVLVVVDTGMVVVYSKSTTVPGSDVAPGPGSDTAPLMRRLEVDGTQNTEARIVEAGTPNVSGPAGSPVSRIRRHDVEFGLVKHPA